jgi:hypothetical protein
LRRPVEDHELLIPRGCGTTPPPSKSQRKKAARQKRDRVPDEPEIPEETQVPDEESQVPDGPEKKEDDPTEKDARHQLRDLRRRMRIEASCDSSSEPSSRRVEVATVANPADTVSRVQDPSDETQVDSDAVGYEEFMGTLTHRTHVARSSNNMDVGSLSKGKGKGKGSGKSEGKGGKNVKGKKGFSVKGAKGSSTTTSSDECQNLCGFSMCGFGTESNVVGGWLRFTYDTGAAVTAFPLDSPGKHTDPNPNATYRTASGEIIEDAGGLIVQGESEHGEAIRLKGRKADVHKVLVSSAQVRRAKPYLA